MIKSHTKILIAVIFVFLSVICLGIFAACGHAHEYVEDAGIAATCTTKGKTVGAHCSVCGKVLIEQQVIETVPHTYGEQWTEIEKASCILSGLKERECSECGHKDSAVIPALGHTYIEDGAVAATFAETGLTGGAHCLVCDEILVAQAVIPKLKYEDYAYKVIFQNDEHSNVIMYETPEFEEGGGVYKQYSLFKV